MRTSTVVAILFLAVAAAGVALLLTGCAESLTVARECLKDPARCR